MSGASWIERRVLVTVGTGGVGKTTVSAAIALEAARRGKRALVLTIDPARRLADALGIAELGHEASAVPGDYVDGPGSLEAMMLDTKRTFDELVKRYAPNEAAIDRIFENPIYQNLTDALAGSREYSAMERLHQLHDSGDYDLIVLDTPPASHALDFLDAPRRLTGFLDNQILKLLFRPAIAMGRTGLRLFRFGSGAVLKVVERITGMEFLRMVSEFLLAFESLLDGFTERARQIETLLRSPEVGFVLVTGPDPVQTRLAQEFWARLEQEHIRLVGLVQNRVRLWPGGGPAPELGADAAAAGAATLAKAFEQRNVGFDASHAARAIADAVTRHAELVRRDAQLAAELRAVLPLGPQDAKVVPRFAQDLHTSRGLRRMGDHLFDERT